MSAFSYHSRGSFFSTVSMIGFWFTGIMLALYLFQVVYKFTRIPWIRIEMWFCVAITLFYMLASSLAAALRWEAYTAAAVSDDANAWGIGPQRIITSFFSNFSSLVFVQWLRTVTTHSWNSRCFVVLLSLRRHQPWPLRLPKVEAGIHNRVTNQNIWSGYLSIFFYLILFSCLIYICF